MFASSLSAQLDPFRYTVSFPAPTTHYAEVDAIFPSDQGPTLELFMAVWTPGSYLVREYARNIESLAAFDSHDPLAISKTRKNRWVVETKGARSVRVHYRVYCREMTVRTNWVDERFALLNGAPTFLSVVGKLDHPHDITIVLPPDWKRTMTGLPEAAAGPNHYVAENYDALVDSPILAGNPAVYEFAVDGIPHFLVNEGEEGLWDGPRSATDVERIVRQNRKMWGSLPYSKYVFLNILGEGGGGGLEHKNSVCLMSSRFGTRTRQAYAGWLDLVSHEYFHLWNVKRLRPAELGPFDYENENYTKGLWVSEGFTDYYAGLNVQRAGLTKPEEYLAGVSPGEHLGGLSRMIEALQTTPGRLEQPVEMASYDAWIKLYRPDENSGNTGISYYTKGAVIGWLLDARIRSATSGKRSLDDVMRLAYERYSGPRGFTDAQFRQTAQDVAGTDLQPWFHEVLQTTKELDYSQALNLFGLQLKPPDPPKPGAPAKASLGFATKVQDGRLIVMQVPRGTPAFAAGFSADDEILAVDNFRVRPEQWPQRMEEFHAGERISVLVSRRERLVRVEAVLGDERKTIWRLQIRPDATAEQTKELDAWLGL